MSLSKSILALLLLTTAARACDLCGCYTPSLEVVHAKIYGFYAGVAEQFTHFGTTRFNGDKVDDPAGQHLDSSITQAFIGAAFADNRFSLQVNIPYIHREYQRPAGFDIERGDESGLGDVSLLANVRVFRIDRGFHNEAGSLSKDGKSSMPATRSGEPDFSATLNLLAGIKFPTGDASRIKEEFVEEEIEGAPESGIHGHDLALGTGSYDAILGAEALVRYRSIFFQAEVQYAIRGRGHYSYRFANDLLWSGGPGVYLYRRGTDSVALQCVVAGETKGYDRFRGEDALDTGTTMLSVGPRVSASLGKWSGDLGLDLPVISNATKFQTTADYRIRAGLTFHF